MRAEVISIGDELTSGQRLDTNSQWLSERLGELGLRVLYHTTVADDLDANIRVFQTAIDRADVIVATGGLGPTADDLTRDALAAVSGKELVLHSDVLDHIRGLFARFNRDMPESNRVQAMFPTGSRIIANPHGTAPGIDLEIARPGGRPARIFALPGVPAEMMEMWQESVERAIGEHCGRVRVIRHRRIKCFGAGESHVEQMLPDLIRRGREPSVGITVSGAVITLRITASGESAEACYQSMEPTIATIRECLGDLIYGEDDDELEHAVVRLLAAKGLTLSIADAGTGGLIASWLSDVAGSQNHFLGGVELNGPRAAARLLDVPESLLNEQDLAGSEVVERMAVACRNRFGSDLALAMSDLPKLGRAASETPRVFFALATPRGIIVRSTPHAGHPSILKQRAGRQALNLLRLALLRDRME